MYEKSSSSITHENYCVRQDKKDGKMPFDVDLCAFLLTYSQDL